MNTLTSCFSLTAHQQASRRQLHHIFPFFWQSELLGLIKTTFLNRLKGIRDFQHYSRRKKPCLILNCLYWHVTDPQKLASTLILCCEQGIKKSYVSMNFVVGTVKRSYDNFYWQNHNSPHTFSWIKLLVVPVTWTKATNLCILLLLWFYCESSDLVTANQWVPYHLVSLLLGWPCCCCGTSQHLSSKSPITMDEFLIVVAHLIMG